MGFEDLLLEKDGGIATITLNNPEKLNAFSPKMGESLSLAIDEIAKDDEIRVVIVTGAGRGFCSGADVTSFKASRGEAAEPSRYTPFQEATGWPWALAFPKLSKPVIAAVNGPCAGGGFSVAMSCDIRIASERAMFIVAQVARALVPDLGLTHFLPSTMGTAKSLELMLTADRIDAAEAERLGIVSRVVPPDELMKVARELAAKIIQQAPISVALTKQIVWQSLLADLARKLDLESWSLGVCFGTEDHQEASRAFLEKGPQPKFKGK